MFQYVKSWAGWFVIPFFFDRITKCLVVSGIVSERALLSFLDIYLTYNRGFSWGIGSSSCHGQFLLMSAFIAMVIVWFCWYMHSTKMNRLEYNVSLLILSGAVSNFYDRIRFDGVIDFILFHWSDWSFPVFNMADVFISVGTCLFLYLQCKK